MNFPLRCYKLYFDLPILPTKKLYERAHNPSPYLRRYRLPTVNSSATVAAYEELLSPVDNCAKLAYISALNCQNKQFCIAKPTSPNMDNMPPHNDPNKLTTDQAKSFLTSGTLFKNSTPLDRGNPWISSNKNSAIDFEFRFVATELKKRSDEYDTIMSDLTFNEGAIINEASEESN
ncbi:unnamed protein product [Thelazia callipaeda]|uniref:Uncharacterized protein n=1 Tax=Thelazia callipaeda TaxID=103827 RepID=A0A0N5CYU1_THECL|nr:unnamed protein product [Thelazia callipaeda]